MRQLLLYAILFLWGLNPVSAQWSKLNTPTTNNLYAINFVSARFGVAVGATGTVLKTKDGGNTWTIVASPDSADIVSVLMLDSVTILVATANTYGKAAVYKTTTGGNTWKKFLHDSRSIHLAASSNGKLYCIGDSV